MRQKIPIVLTGKWLVFSLSLLEFPAGTLLLAVIREVEGVADEAPDVCCAEHCCCWWWRSVAPPCECVLTGTFAPTKSNPKMTNQSVHDRVSSKFKGSFPSFSLSFCARYNSNQFKIYIEFEKLPASKMKYKLAQNEIEIHNRQHLLSLCTYLRRNSSALKVMEKLGRWTMWRQIWTEWAPESKVWVPVLGYR